MKTMNALMAFAMVVGLTSGSLAASIENLSGQSCGEFSGTWHFVNNQTQGAAAGSLTAEWDSGDTCTVTTNKRLANTQHFDCVASGELLSASTNLPGRLVLSDFSCDNPKCEKAPEICDGLDNDCDGKVDEELKGCKPYRHQVHALDLGRRPDRLLPKSPGNSAHSLPTRKLRPCR